MAVAAYLVIARSCDYDHVAVLSYAAYLAGYVFVPGAILTRIALRRRPSVLEFMSWGIPLGFAVEIATFLLLSWSGLRGVISWLPATWGALGLALLFRGRTRPLTSYGAGWGTPAAWCAVAGLALAICSTTASQMYAGSPVVSGVLGGSTHHDWVYLLSRAAEIKQHWPLENPSLAGQPLSYHYFLLVHIASASRVTGISIDLIGLRLCVLPLGLALLAQALSLGRAQTRVLWGSVIAAAILFVFDELSLFSDADQGVFGSNFARWLFISPTFFFGMIYTGALLLWVYRMLAYDAFDLREWAATFLLAAAGTGAKGTVVPPLALALGMWIAIDWIRTRRAPRRAMGVLSALLLGFGLVYVSILAAWGTGSATFTPFMWIRITQFWLEHVDSWTAACATLGLSPSLSRSLAMGTCASVIFIGFLGLRLLGVWAALRWKQQSNPTLALWLGLAAFAYFAFGQLIMLDSNGQLYLLYPVQLPLAVLSAAAVVKICGAVKARLGEFGVLYPVYARGAALLFLSVVTLVAMSRGALSWWMGMLLVNAAALLIAPKELHLPDLRGTEFLRFCWRATPLFLIATVTLVQVDNWRQSNAQGLRIWAQQKPALDPNVALLREAMEWVRGHTARDAVIVANAFSSKNLRPDALACLDNTTVDKYFYYSAWAERRFWVEGPSYLLNQYRAQRRIEAASRFFYEGAPASTLMFERKSRPNYVLIDRALRDGASAPLPDDCRVFENARIAIYRLPTLPPMVAQQTEMAVSIER